MLEEVNASLYDDLPAQPDANTTYTDSPQLPTYALT